MNNILTDLDDFLAPSLECIKMVPPVNGKMQPGGNSAQIEMQNDLEMEEFKVEIKKKPDLIKTKDGEKTAKISLQDCLACSGCITSAETVLIQQHSIAQFLKLFHDDTDVYVAISP
jgi:iron only hydrogenase large subunit-like protein